MAGLNGYEGNTFDDITRGNTIPFTFTFKDAAGDPIDVTGWKFYISYNNNLDSGIGGSGSYAEAEIPITDAAGGVFSGSVPDSETYALTAGSCYACASYVKDTGEHIIVDMAKIKVLEGVTARLDQT